jgi:hypothetical protein
VVLPYLSHVSGLPAHISPAAPAGKHVRPTQASGDHLCLPTPDTEVRQQKGVEGDTTLDLVLEHPDATIATYV